MEDQERNNEGTALQNNSEQNDNANITMPLYYVSDSYPTKNVTSDHTRVNTYMEETTSEVASPISFNRDIKREGRNNEGTALQSNSEQNNNTNIAMPSYYVGDSFPNYHVTSDQTRANNDYMEETAAEVAPPVSFNREIDREDRREVETSGRGIGWAALALSIISLFVMPVFLGAVGIVLGFIALRRGTSTLGSWAIGIGAVSIILGIFVMPFF